MFGEQTKAEISCKIFVHSLPVRGPKPIKDEPLKRATTIALLVKFLKMSVTQI